MRRPPAVEREEAPEEELPRVRVQTLEPASGDAKRDDSGPFVDDLGDAQAETERGRERSEEAEDDDQGERRDVQALPVPIDRRVQHELVSGRDLVEPAERDAGV